MNMDTRQLAAYEALAELVGLREIPGHKDHPWITKAWKIVGASWYDDDETAWCGATVGRVLKEAGLPILDGGMSVQARAWHEKGWGVEVPLEQAPKGALIVLRHHVGFLHSLVYESGRVTGIRMLGGNQSNAINFQTYPLTADGRLAFLSARVWPAKAGQAPSAPSNPIAALLRALVAFLGKLLGGGK